MLPLQAPAEEEALTEEHRPAKMQRTAPAAKKQRAAPAQQQYRGPLYNEVGPSLPRRLRAQRFHAYATRAQVNQSAEDELRRLEGARQQECNC